MNIVKALLWSVAVHAFLAAGLVLFMASYPGPDVQVSLDVTSVELSLATEDSETAILAQSALHQSAATERQPDPSKEEHVFTPGTIPPELPQPPEMLAETFPEPTPEIERLQEMRPEPASDPAVAPRQAKIDAPPRPRRAIRPDYPRTSRQRGEQGDVQLEIAVGASGTVESVRVLRSSGFNELDVAAVRAASTAMFMPAESSGRPVASKARLMLTFKLK